MIATTVFIESNAQQPVWQRASGLGAGYVSRILVDDDDRVYVASGGDLFISTDRGDTWNDSWPHKTSVVELAVNRDGDIFASSRDGRFLRSTDAASSWQRVDGIDTAFVYFSFPRFSALNDAGDSLFIGGWE
ncbi:MAG: hypothetical protein H7X80_02670, partial [bacterium]|nr:hypothetical protein [Candidatus Kapabacteria bacterium]